MNRVRGNGDVVVSTHEALTDDLSSSAFDRVLRAIERRPAYMHVGISLLALAIILYVAASRLLWFDELITLYIAKTGSLHAVWHALARGADPNPPLTHLLVLWSTRLFGEGSFAVRLPLIIAGWVGVVLLFSYLRKRLSVAYSAIGVLFFISTRAFDYSYECRSYALTLCFCITALVLWRAAVEGRHGVAACAGLALSLAAGISSNYFGVLAFFPIAAGELVRTLQLRRIDWRVWIALLVGGLPIFVYMPLISHAISQFSPYAWNKPDADFFFISYRLNLDLGLYAAAIIIEAAVAVHLYLRANKLRATPPVLPTHEFVAMVTLIAFPFIGYAIAVLRAGMIAPRFVLPMCYGVAMAVAIACYKLFSKSSVATVMLLLASLGWALARNVNSASQLLDEREDFYHLQAALPRDGKLVVSDSLLALPLYHYSPPSIASRIVVPFDLESIRKYKGEDSAEQNLRGGRGILPIPVVALDDLECESPNCYIVSPGANWLIAKLVADHTPAMPLAIDTRTRHLNTKWLLFGFTFGGSVYIFEPPE